MISRTFEAPAALAPNRALSDKVLLQLSRALGDSKFLSSEESCTVYQRDDSEAAGLLPSAVVLASSEADIQATLAVAHELEVPVTPRAAGTGRTGGAVPVAGGIVLVTLGMNSIREIDVREGLAVVQPGVVLKDLHAAVEAEGWFYPPDPNSLANCALGGNVAENAGGPRAFKYGVTRDYVLGLTALLMGGQRLQVGRRTLKGVTGYDVTGLLVGSEGTLAVFSEMTLHLIPKPESVTTLLALFTDVTAAAECVAEMTGRARLVPRCIELLDGPTLEALRRAGNPIDPRARALLLIEVDGSEAECEVQAERVGLACESQAALEVLAATEPSQRERLWSARREMSYAIRKLSKHKLSEDVVVPRQCIPTLLERVARSSEKHRVRSLTYGHAGDGNLHVNFLWDEPEEAPRVEHAIRELFENVVALRGTLSGEHGIGVLKAPYLPLEQAPELIALQRDLKRVFDPKHLLNPGKIFPPAAHRAC